MLVISPMLAPVRAPPIPDSEHMPLLPLGETSHALYTDSHSKGGSRVPSKMPSRVASGLESALGVNVSESPEGYDASQFGVGGAFDVGEEKSTFTTVLDLWRQYWPAAGTLLVFYGNQTMCASFVGRNLGPKVLAHYVVGVSVYNVTGQSVCVGVATALDTLAPQLYGAGGKGRPMGTLFIRSILICGLVATFVAIGFWFSKPALVFAFGEDLAPGVAEYLFLSIPMLYFQVAGSCLRRILQGKRVASVALMSSIACAVVCPIANMIFTTPEYGLPGAVIALTLSGLVEFLAGYVLSMMDSRVTFITSRGALLVDWPAVFDLKHTIDFTKLGLAAFGTVVASWWVFELFTVMAARFGSNAVAAYGVNMTILVAVFSFPQGLSVASAVLIGNALGQGRPELAKKVAWLTIVMGGVITTTFAMLLYVFADTIASWFTSDEVVRGLMHQTRWALPLTHLNDAMQGTARGLYKGTGRQVAGLWVVSIALWGISVPLGLALAFKMEWEVTGLYIGLDVGLFAAFFAMIVVAMWWNWQQLSEETIAWTISHHVKDEAEEEIFKD